MKPVEPRSEEPRSLLLPSLAVLAACLVLMGLGTWQLQRKTWKDGLITTLTERLAAAPAPLPDRALWPKLGREDYEFTRVAFTAEFLNDKEALVYSAGSTLRAGEPGGAGYAVFTPARLAGGGIVMVNRGYAPESFRDPASRAAGQTGGQIEIVGVLRWPDAPSAFAPAPDPRRNVWYSRDSTAIAAAKGIDAAPFYVEQEAPTPSGGWPRPARLQPNLPNNHLQYVVTWYGLAAALAAVFVAWIIRRRRERRERIGAQ